MTLRLAHRIMRRAGITAATLAAITAATVTPAHAVPLPENERLVLFDVSVQEVQYRSSIGGVQWSLHPYGGTPTTVMTDTQGIEMHAVLSSCGKVVTERTSVMRGFDAFIYVGFGNDPRYFSSAPSDIGDRIGPSIDYTLTVTEPGYDPYTFTGSTSTYTSRPSCEDLAGDNAAGIPIKAWSVKYAQPDAKVGSNLTISDTRADGAHIGYVWTVATKSAKSGSKTIKKSSTIVSRGYRTLKVKKGWKGKDLSVTVTVTKGTGKRAKTLTKTINYGTVY